MDDEDKIERIHHAIGSFDFKIAWILQSANSVADSLAKEGVS